MATNVELIIGTAVASVGATLIGKVLWDRWQAPSKVQCESRKSDSELRSWMGEQLKDLRIWLEDQFRQGRTTMERHDERIRAVEMQVEVRKEVCDLRHSGIRRTDDPNAHPEKDRCGGGERVADTL